MSPAFPLDTANFLTYMRAEYRHGTVLDEWRCHEMARRRRYPLSFSRQHLHRNPSWTCLWLSRRWRKSWPRGVRVASRS